MEQNHQTGNEHTFTNDAIADLVIHKDDSRLDKGLHEPEENISCHFPIHFMFNGKDYTADVKQHGSVMKEYHVTAVHPAISFLPDPYIVAEHISKEKYDFPVNETYYPVEFGNNIVDAISYALDVNPPGDFF